MPAQPAAVPMGRTIRLIHIAIMNGIVLFALVAHLLVRRGRVVVADLGDAGMQALLAGSVVACALALVLKGRVPRRAADEPIDQFWPRASGPAIVTWAVLELAGLASVFVYMRTGAVAAIGLAVVAVLALGVVNPGYFERR